jgi:hypothetical protein
MHALMVLKFEGKNMFFLKMCIIVLHYHCQSQKTKKLDLQNVAENLGTEVLNNQNSVQNMLNKSCSEFHAK